MTETPNDSSENKKSKIDEFLQDLLKFVKIIGGCFAILAIICGVAVLLK